jgi:lysosomal acid lipase/cholesteryl ester hydrolase
MGNNRGTRWSETHTTLNKNDKDFWQWSWEEMGVYDTPAFIDFILNHTGNDKITYIGHSEGTSQIMSGGTLIPEYYTEKMLVALFLAPPAAMAHNTVPVFELLSYKFNRDLVVDTANLIGLYDLLPYNFLNTGVGVLFCNLFNGKFCDLLLDFFADADPTYDDTDRYEMYVSNLPAGSGYLDVVHYAQLIDLTSSAFRRFDHGKQGNMLKYG